MLKKLFGLRTPRKGVVKSRGIPRWEVVQRRNAPRWVQKQIDSIYRGQVQADVGKIVVYRLKGRRYSYKLEFSVISSWGTRDWGPVVVSRRRRT